MEFATVQRFDGEVPCLKLSDGELAPISLTEFFGDGAFSPYGFGSWPDLWWDRKFSFRGPYEMLRRSGPQEDGIVLTDVRKAEHGIQRSLHEFLSYRFAGMNRWAEWYKEIEIRKSSKSPSASFLRSLARGLGLGGPPVPRQSATVAAYRYEFRASHRDCGFISRRRTSSTGCILAAQRHPSRATYSPVAMFSRVTAQCC
jgi:hypothetical protein